MKILIFVILMAGSLAYSGDLATDDNEPMAKDNGVLEGAVSQYPETIVNCATCLLPPSDLTAPTNPTDDTKSAPAADDVTH